MVTVAFTKNGKQVVSISSNGELKFWDVDSGKALKSYRVQFGVVSAAFSPNRKRIAIGDRKGALGIFDLSNGGEELVMQSKSNRSSKRAVASKEKTSRSAAQDKKQPTGQAKPTPSEASKTKSRLVFNGHESEVSSAAFFPDGQRIVSGGKDKTVRIWDALRGIELQTLKGHYGPVNCVAVSSDGKHIVSGSDDNTLVLWDADSGEHLETLEGSSSGIVSADFSLDGKWIIGTCKSGPLKAVES